jgi:hypothetical protein
LPAGNGDAREGHAFYDLSNAALLRHQEAYADRMIREMAAHWNVIFEVCNEYCDLDYHPGPADWEAHWIRFIRERCSHPVMVNNLGRDTDPPGTPERYWSMPDLDAVSWHTIWPEEAYDRFVRFHDQGKAMIHGEQAFSANENTTRPRTMSARDLRHLAWGAFLGGGHLIWDEPNGEDDQDALVATRGVLRFLRETGFDVLTARPRPDLAPGAWALDNDRQTIVYSPEGSAFTLPDAALPPESRWRWFDPVAATFGPVHRSDDAGAMLFEPPDGRDQVLLVDRGPAAT